jgi:hypothetical protein
MYAMHAPMWPDYHVCHLRWYQLDAKHVEKCKSVKKKIGSNYNMVFLILFIITALLLWRVKKDYKDHPEWFK